ncbi:MAG: 2OG-Fe(II) oxygenase [Candidatus Saccharimonadales bacterium]
MRWLRWQTGRQGTGYQKLLLLESKLLHIDAWILKYGVGAHIPMHNDPIPGRKHWRVNVVLWEAQEGGGPTMAHVNDGKTNPNPIWWRPRIGRRWTLSKYVRVAVFRSDLCNHCVSKIEKGTRIVLSLGWAPRDRS